MEQKERKEILIIDDIQENINSLKRVFRKENFQIYELTDPLDALSVLDKNKIDLILLDVKMPNIDGFELARTIKKDEKLSAIPIFFITGLDDETNAKRSNEFTNTFYITKPFDNEELLLKARAILDL